MRGNMEERMFEKLKKIDTTTKEIEDRVVDAVAEICEYYCKYFESNMSDDELENICEDCPFTRL